MTDNPFFCASGLGVGWKSSTDLYPEQTSIRGRIKERTLFMEMVMAVTDNKIVCVCCAGEVAQNSAALSAVVFCCAHMLGPPSRA